MSLNAQRLREILKDVPDDVVIVLSKDAEGNGYSPLAATTEPGQYHYEAESTWSGDIYDPDEKDGQGDFEYEPEERKRLKKLPGCVVLWPTN